MYFYTDMYLAASLQAVHPRCTSGSVLEEYELSVIARNWENGLPQMYGEIYKLQAKHLYFH